MIRRKNKLRKEEGKTNRERKKVKQIEKERREKGGEGPCSLLGLRFWEGS